MTADLDNIDFEQLIGDRNIDACWLIERISMLGIAWALYRCAFENLEERWPEAEPFICRDPRSAYHYARFLIKGRWPEAEPYIMKDPEWYNNYLYSHYFGVR